MPQLSRPSELLEGILPPQFRTLYLKRNLKELVLHFASMRDLILSNIHSLDVESREALLAEAHERLSCYPEDDGIFGYMVILVENAFKDRLYFDQLLGYSAKLALNVRDDLINILLCKYICFLFVQKETKREGRWLTEVAAIDPLQQALKAVLPEDFLSVAFKRSYVEIADYIQQNRSRVQGAILASGKPQDVLVCVNQKIAELRLRYPDVLSAIRGFVYGYDVEGFDRYFKGQGLGIREVLIQALLCVSIEATFLIDALYLRLAEHCRDQSDPLAMLDFMMLSMPDLLRMIDAPKMLRSLPLVSDEVQGSTAQLLSDFEALAQHRLLGHHEAFGRKYLGDDSGGDGLRERAVQLNAVELVETHLFLYLLRNQSALVRPSENNAAAPGFSMS